MGAPLLLISLVLGACGQGDRPSSSDGAAEIPRSTPAVAAERAIETAVVTAAPAASSLILPGRVAYGEDRYSLISSPVRGRVVDVRAKLGDEVKAGDILLVIDSPDIATAYSEFVKEHSELAYAKRHYEMAKDLHAIKALSQKELKQAENDFVKAIAEFRRTRERLISLNIPAEELNKPLSQQQVTSQFFLRSPLAGRVVERTVTLGQGVGNEPPQILFTVAELTQVQFVADVYERDLGVVKVGQEGMVAVESYPREQFPAVIFHIGDVVDPTTRTIKIRAWVDNEALRLKPNMFGRLELNLTEVPSVPQIPETAVFDREGRSYVFVEDKEGRYLPREVRVRPAREGTVAILEGLVPGERVVTKGAVLLEKSFESASRSPAPPIHPE